MVNVQFDTIPYIQFNLGNSWC